MDSAVMHLRSLVRDATAPVVVVVALASLLATGCLELMAIPPRSVCAPLVPPLDQPRFARVELTRATPAPAQPGLDKIDPAIFAQNVRMRLAEIPFFKGGSWPAVSLSLDVAQFESGSAGCGALWIPGILLFPGYWLFGGPISCYRVDVVVTWSATVGGFQREYTYELVDYSTVGIYYSGELLGPGDVYLGHTLWALAGQLAEDYARFERKELPAHPEPFQDSLDGDDGDWYDPIADGTRKCPGAPALGGVGAPGGAQPLNPQIQIAVSVGLFAAGEDLTSRQRGARQIGLLCGQQILQGLDDPWVAQGEGALRNPAKPIGDPALQADVDEALARIHCARECAPKKAAGEAVDCTSTCKLAPAP